MSWCPGPAPCPGAPGRRWVGGLGQGGVQAVGLGPVGVEVREEVHGVGGGGHVGEAATTRPAILTACRLSEVGVCS